MVHASPLSQIVKSGLFSKTQRPVPALQTPLCWHVSGAGHTTWFSPVQIPEPHRSFSLHALPSSQTVPSASGGLEHIPVATLQTPTSWHWSRAVQTMGSPGSQLPSIQTSPTVHALLSSHAEPKALTGLSQSPVSGAHTPMSWHWLRASQTTGLLPTQLPA